MVMVTFNAFAITPWGSEIGLVFVIFISVFTNVTSQFWSHPEAAKAHRSVIVAVAPGGFHVAWNH